MIARSRGQMAFMSDFEKYFGTYSNTIRVNTGNVYARKQQKHLQVVETAEEYGGFHLGAFHNTSLVGYASFSPPRTVDLPYYSVGQTAVDRSWAGSQIARQLIEWFVNTHRWPLLSDESQSFEGSYVWESMICR